MKLGHKIIEYRPLKTLDVERYINDLNDAAWSLIDTCNNVDMMVDYFEMLFWDVLDSHTVKRKRVKYSTVPDWLTEEIRFAITNGVFLKRWKEAKIIPSIFNSYLTDRSQKVSYNQIMSSSVKVLSGVRQGSILGPLLFLVFVNDMFLTPKLCHLKMFADDSTINTHGDSIEELNFKLSNDVKSIIFIACNQYMLEL